MTVNGNRLISASLATWFLNWDFNFSGESYSRMATCIINIPLYIEYLKFNLNLMVFLFITYSLAWVHLMK